MGDVVRAETAGTSFAVVGEALVDVVHGPGRAPARSPGGSPLNVAVGLARLGCRAVLLTQLGADDDGALLRSHVEASGVELDDRSSPDHRTSAATATLDDEGAATYDFDLSWPTFDATPPLGTGWLHTGSLGAALRPGRESVLTAVAAAADAGTPVSFDPNARPALTPDGRAAWADVLELARLTTITKLSEEDVEFLQPDAALDQVAEELLTGRPELVVVTRGADGAAAWTDRGRVDVPALPVEVADTVGAGDSFMAALLAVVAGRGVPGDDAALTAALGAALRAAAITVSRPGADPPWRRELPAEWPD